MNYQKLKVHFDENGQLLDSPNIGAITQMNNFANVIEVYVKTPAKTIAELTNLIGQGTARLFCKIPNVEESVYSIPKTYSDAAVYDNTYNGNGIDENGFIKYSFEIDSRITQYKGKVECTFAMFQDTGKDITFEEGEETFDLIARNGFKTFTLSIEKSAVRESSELDIVDEDRELFERYLDQMQAYRSVFTTSGSGDKALFDNGVYDNLNDHSLKCVPIRTLLVNAYNMNVPSEYTLSEEQNSKVLILKNGNNIKNLEDAKEYFRILVGSSFTNIDKQNTHYVIDQEGNVWLFRISSALYAFKLFKVVTPDYLSNELSEVYVELWGQMQNIISVNDDQDRNIRAIQNGLIVVKANDAATNRRIDSTLKKLDTVEQKVENAQPLQMESRVSTLEKNATALDTRVTTAEGNITTINSNITTMQSDINSLRNDLNAQYINEHEETFKGVLNVPQNALKYAVVTKAVGKSIVSENLLKLADKSATTKNGITYSISNGVITLNGTATDTTYIDLISELTEQYYSINLFNNKIVNDVDAIYAANNVAWGAVSCDKINSSGTINFFSNKNNSFILRISTGVTINSLVIKPMLVKGNVAPTTYKQGFEGIKNLGLSKAVSKGDNLLKLKDKAPTTTNGITYKIENGVITLNGTANQLIDTLITTINVESNAKYYLKDFGIQDKGAIRLNGTFETENGSYISTFEIRDVAFTTPSNCKQIRISLFVFNGISCNNVQIKPMFIKGNVAPTTFIQYTQPIDNLTQIMAEIDTLVKSKGYDINVENNEVNFETKKAIIRSKVNVDNNGIDTLATAVEIDLSSVIKSPMDSVIQLIPNGNLEIESNTTLPNGYDSNSVGASVTLVYQTKGK